jgi:cytochrome P450
MFKADIVLSDREKFAVSPQLSQLIVDPASYVGERKIEAALGSLRSENPIGWVQAEGFDPFWLITRHADVREVSRQHDVFHVADRALFLMDSASVRFLEKAGTLNPSRTIVNMDNPDHDKYRALTQKWFMPHHLATYTQAIGKIAGEMIERMISGEGTCDFVEDVALRYPLRVILEILGAPREDEELVLKLAQQMLGVTDPDLRRDDDIENQAEGYSDGVTEFKSYFRDLMLSRRRNPREDVASIIANSDVDGKLIDEESCLGYYIAIATAGHDTTSSSTAGAIWALAENPAEFAKIKADPRLIPSMVEEAIRWTTPVQHFMRSAADDYVLDGRAIAKGDWLMLSYISANRDENVFVEPERFIVDRRPNPHLSFGYGLHLCLGMHLARLEMRIFFEELLPRISSLKLAGTPDRVLSSFIAGPKRLPIHFGTSGA